MKLPNHESAILPREKIRDYLLSTTHPDGRHKAAFFLRFGFNRDSWQTLGEALLRHAALHDVVKTETTASVCATLLKASCQRQVS